MTKDLERIIEHGRNNAIAEVIYKELKSKGKFGIAKLATSLGVAAALEFDDESIFDDFMPIIQKCSERGN